MTQVGKHRDQHDAVPSPCISVCELDEQQVCRGCLRSVEEIMRWSRADDNEKRSILALVEQRRSEAAGPVFPAQRSDR